MNSLRHKADAPFGWRAILTVRGYGDRRAEVIRGRR
jgi:hypothetical protein